MRITFPDYLELGKPFTIHADSDNVLTYVDDVYQGKTDKNGNITLILERDIKVFYHPGKATELMLCCGFTNKQKRQLVSPEMQHLLTHPFWQAGFNLGYYMLFLTREEYQEISPTIPATSLSLFKQKYSLPVPIHDFITILPHGELQEGSCNLAILDPTEAMEVAYNRPSSVRCVARLVILWHELNHDVTGILDYYDPLPFHGGNRDLRGMSATSCIMCVGGGWFFCPRCRSGLRQHDPSIHCFYTEEEKQEMIDKHLYWFYREYLDNNLEYAVGQIHQPQEQCSNVQYP